MFFFFNYKFKEKSRKTKILFWNVLKTLSYDMIDKLRIQVHLQYFSLLFIPKWNNQKNIPRNTYYNLSRSEMRKCYSIYIIIETSIATTTATITT